MGLLWRLLAPKPIKKVRRPVGKVANPGRTLTPKPIKKVQRSVRTVTNPTAGGIPSRRSAARRSVRWGRWSALQHAKRTPARTAAAAPEKS